MIFKEAAESALKSGIITLPTQDDKRPVYGFKWDSSADGEIPDIFQVAAYPWDKAKGIGYICGIKSGGLFCIDIDGKNDPHKKIASDFKRAILNHNSKLISRLVIESTPNNGFHLVGRCERILGTEVLAKAEDGKDILETRGQGAYFVGSPSPGYKLIQGEFEQIQKFTADEVDLVLTLGRELNREPKKHFTVNTNDGFPEGSLKPGDDYNQKVSEQEFFQQILSDGWKQVGRRGNKAYLCRPGKRGGISATFNNPENPGKLYVFSSSSGLPDRIGLTPYTYKVHKEFGGDFVACSKELYQQGFGARLVTTKTAVNKKYEPPAAINSLESLIFDHEDYSRRHRGVLSGYPFIDNVTGGFYDDLMIILADPGAYKTTFLMNILEQTSKKNEGISVFFSLEMGRHRTLKRYAQMVSGIPAANYYRSVRENSPEWQRAKRLMIENKNFELSDVSRITVAGIVDAVNVIKGKGKKISIIGIDYLDFIESVERNDLDKIKEIMTGIKTYICKDMSIPTILLCQTKRDSNKEVSLRDAKGGTLIEATADYVIGLWKNENEIPECRWLKHRDIANGKYAYSYGGVVLGEGGLHYQIQSINVATDFDRGVSND